MTRESKPKEQKQVGKDLLITCKSGRQFVMRNVSKRSGDIVEAHALSGQSLSIEISDIIKADWVESEISLTGNIYPPQKPGSQSGMHEPHAAKQENK